MQPMLRMAKVADVFGVSSPLSEGRVWNLCVFRGSTSSFCHIYRWERLIVSEWDRKVSASVTGRTDGYI